MYNLFIRKYLCFATLFTLSVCLAMALLSVCFTYGLCTNNNGQQFRRKIKTSSQSVVEYCAPLPMK